MKNILLPSLLSLTFAVGCSKSGSKCEQVYDHTVSLMPAEMKDKLSAGKAQAIAKCEKASPAAQQCALDAKSLEDLMKCPRE